LRLPLERRKGERRRRAVDDSSLDPRDQLPPLWPTDAKVKASEPGPDSAERRHASDRRRDYKELVPMLEESR
jgi:hypothetical protein